MFFTYTSEFYISENDLQRMINLCIEEEYSIDDAITEIAQEWDDCDYYQLHLIYDQLEAEINKRLPIEKDANKIIEVIRNHPNGIRKRAIAYASGLPMKTVLSIVSQLEKQDRVTHKTINDIGNMELYDLWFIKESD